MFHVVTASNTISDIFVVGFSKIQRIFHSDVEPTGGS